MKVTIKINGAEVILEAQKPEEVGALGLLAASILEGAPSALKRTRKSASNIGADSDLSLARLKAVEWVLSTNARPMNAPEVAAEVRNEQVFHTKAGDPVHIVRRVLSDGVQEGVFKKTSNGMFMTPIPEPSEVRRPAPAGYRVPVDTDVDYLLADDTDDPFADN